NEEYQQAHKANSKEREIEDIATIDTVQIKPLSAIDLEAWETGKRPITLARANLKRSAGAGEGAVEPVYAVEASPPVKTSPGSDAPLPVLPARDTTGFLQRLQRFLLGEQKHS